MSEDRTVTVKCAYCAFSLTYHDPWGRPHWESLYKMRRHVVECHNPISEETIVLENGDVVITIGKEAS